MNVHSNERGFEIVRQIKKAAVLGSGVMGSQIAAHLANVGIHVLLLDIVPTELTAEEKQQGLTLKDPIVRNRYAQKAVQRLQKQTPAPLTAKENIERIEIGNFDDDIEKIAEADWVIEAVVERLDIKQKVFEKVDKWRRPGSIISTNTSGVSVHSMSENRSEDFRKHFLGTHFFNPPRYLKLLEIIPTKDTDEQVVAFMKRFGEDVLGKGVVCAKDTPNFIANRIGTYGFLVTVREMLKGNYSVGEVDSVTGPLIGRPKSATFHTLDVVGLDTFFHVVNNVYERVDGEEKEIFRVPDFMKKMHENGWIGSKAGQGFYKKTGKEILELNVNTMEYENRKKLRADSIEIARREKGTGEKLKAVVYSNDRAGTLIWKILIPTLLYSAEQLDSIAETIVDIDQAMKWGFGWELGPFEMWDAIGIKRSVETIEQQGGTVPAWVKQMLKDGNETFYKQSEGATYFYHRGEYRLLQTNMKQIHVQSLKNEKSIIKENNGASLIDIGDDIALLEFHSKNNAIGYDIVQMIDFAIDEVDKNYKGLVIGNEGKHFCVGANLAFMLMEAQDENYFEIELMIRKFQQAMMKIKYSPKPVVAAPFHMTLGGGAEVCLPASSIQAAMETYIGLVETGVGLIPGGGGNKELYIKILDQIGNDIEIDLQKVANKTFETIAMAKVSKSAQEAQQNGFLQPTDAITINKDHLLYDAKQKALFLYESGYRPPVRKKIPVVGETGYAAMILGAQNLYLSGYASEHDVKIAKKLAYVIAGGKLPYRTKVDEQYLLDLEREAFLSLIGEPKTQARMQHMLLKGKPLRN